MRLENKRPCHHRRAVGISPAENQRTFPLKGEEHKSLGDPRQRWEYVADANVLELRDDPPRARPAPIVEEVIAVPPRTTAGTHLRKPRPHHRRLSAQDDRVGHRSRCDTNDIIARKSARS